MARRTPARIAGWRGNALWLLAVIVGFILVPFFVFGASLETWVVAEVTGDHPARLAVFAATVGLMAADVLAPIPSSVVATASGAALGLTQGTVANWVGMTLGSTIGYGIGAGVFARLRRSSLADAPHPTGFSRATLGVVAATRGVPVLAEAVTLLAGANRLSFIPFILTSALANLGVAAAYAWVGAKAASVNSFMIALAGSIVLPATALLMAKLLKRR